MSLTFPSGANENVMTIFTNGADFVEQGSSSSILTLEPMTLAWILQNVDKGQGISISMQ